MKLLRLTLSDKSSDNCIVVDCLKIPGKKENRK